MIQIIQTFTGKMSIIGAKTALWNQVNLIKERDKYSVNCIWQRLTGWIQFNGRDNLEIAVKAKLDGEYVDKISFFFDYKCFIGTIVSVLKLDEVVEEGT